MKNRKLQIKKEYGYAVLDGKYFAEKINTDGRTILEEIDKKVAIKKFNLLKEIAEKLKDSLDREAVLMEAMSILDEEYLIQIHNALYNSKRKIKPITRKHHCVDMKVGKLIIPIVG